MATFTAAAAGVLFSFSAWFEDAASNCNHAGGWSRPGNPMQGHSPLKATPIQAWERERKAACSLVGQPPRESRLLLLVCSRARKLMPRAASCPVGSYPYEHEPDTNTVNNHQADRTTCAERRHRSMRQWSDTADHQWLVVECSG